MMQATRRLAWPAPFRRLAGDTLARGIAHTAAAVPPFVSVVVACRNEAAFVDRMLDSVLANEYPRDRLEVLIVDGMSDDGTRSVLADYASRYPVVQVRDNPKRTTPHALSLGISPARGA